MCRSCQTFDGSLALGFLLQYQPLMPLVTGTVVDGKVVVEGLALI